MRMWGSGRRLARLAKYLIIVGAFLLLGSCSFGAGSANDVGWTDEDRKVWYQATQGSRLMPLTWFEALERADSQALFADAGYLSETFGFIQSPANIPMTLPIGFTHDKQDDTNLTITNLRWYATQSGSETKAEKWVGLNCAACHTAKLSFKGEELIVDGGPNLLDFQLFVEALDKALMQTRTTPDKWARFVTSVLAGKDSETNRELLEASVDTFLAWQVRTEKMNETSMRYGFGRLDAVGHILNKILMFAGAPDTAGNEANAPVSYPFLWNIWRQDRVQWNGVASNSRIQLPGDPFEYGALGRNAGEVLGVFGDIKLEEKSGTLDTLKGFHSSVRAQNLMRMELLLQRLAPPEWPDTFPKIDQNLAKQGEEIFADKCASCHLPESDWEEGKPTERMISFFDTAKNDPENLTDIWMACNAYLNDGPTGPFNGRKDNDGNVFGDKAPVVSMLAASVKGALINKKGDLIKEGFDNFFGIRRPPVIDEALDPFALPRAAERKLCLETENQLVLGYKARPLDGIWATAPYLHNGSVSSLYELLLPAKERVTNFWVGSREFDAEKVGYVTQKPTEGKAFEMTTHEGGNVILGNSNAGHEYGAAGFTENERWALVEYMKGL